MPLKLHANERLSFPLEEANLVHSPTALHVGGEQIIMYKDSFQPVC